MSAQETWQSLSEPIEKNCGNCEYGKKIYYCTNPNFSNRSSNTMCKIQLSGAKLDLWEWNKVRE